ncbi:AMP-binding protein [Caballeronia sp. 15715]|uniref:AMP-binding protein n=1 Tax=Caballeronia sp. 15715 TaxID=3391030 RepID=UPI0039E44B79
MVNQSTPAISPAESSCWTLVDALRAQAQRNGEAPFVTFEGEDPLSFAALDRMSDACATGLARIGVGQGDRVAIMAENSLAFLVLFWGVQKRRAILIPINTELKGDLLAHQLRDSSPKIIVSDKYLGELSPLMPASVERLVSIGFADGSSAASMTFDDLCAEASPSAILAPESSDLCLILYTSGTSGRAKGVLIPQAHAYIFGLQQARALGVSKEDCFFIALPLFHVNALLMSLGSCLVTGARAYVCVKFSASRWLEKIRACEATITNCLGIMAEFVLRQPETPDDQRHSLRAVMAVPVLASWAEKFESRFGVRLVQVYGMTECNIVSFSDPADSVEPGCVGVPCDEFFDVCIVDPQTDRPLSEDSVGEIVIRPKAPFAFMQGYLGQPEVTLQTWRNLWFHTGDGGRLDRKGRLHFVDRIGDFIRRRGENISPFEIEHVLASHPDIAECAIVGVKIDDAGGEDEVKAYVVLGQTRVGYAELLEWSKVRLPRFAVPRFWEFVDAIDKTATGKVKKKDLRARGVNALTWDRETQCVFGAAPESNEGVDTISAGKELT